MALFLILLLFLCCYQMKLVPVKEFNREYISKNSTTAIKGIFTFLVFMTHFADCSSSNTILDTPYLIMRSHMGQLVVTMFLFYSGFGIYESIKKRGDDYLKSFPKNRLLKTLLHFDCAVILFYIVGTLMGQRFTLTKFLLSLMGWSSLGNSNWFIFAILMQYIMVYCSFKIFRNRKILALVFVTVLSCFYILIMLRYKERSWYDTAFCLPFGLWYSFCKEKIESLVMKNNIYYYSSLITVMVIFAVLYLKRGNLVLFELCAMLFALMIVMFTMKVKIGNKMLYWLGNHVFSIYILQRIPMMVFKKVDFISSNFFVFFIVCFVITVIMSEYFDKLIKIIDSIIFKISRK